MKALKIIWNTITWIIVIIAVLLAFALVGVRAFKIEPYIVLSGSMEPEYKAGSVIYLKEIPDKSQIKVGDPITYKVEGIDEACTHRVIEVEPNTDPATKQKLGEYIFHTKGDANDTADGGVVYSNNVIGRPVFHIPQLGYLANVIKQPTGRMMIISAVCVLLLLMIIPNFFVVEEKKKEDKDQAATEPQAPADQQPEAESSEE